ncbi:MAG: phosphoribosylanthranilate isomerase [Myxococcota bacterium]
MTDVKICGLRTVNDALHCVAVGADAIGLNFWTPSPRSIDRATARAIVEAVGDRVETVGVFVDHSVAEVAEIMKETGIEWAQLQGDETPANLASLLPNAFKAIGVKDGGAVALSRTFGGEHILLDASVPGQRGGTGRTFDWSIAAEVAKERKLTLAGGLNPANVQRAIETVRPFRVDVASGVESSPGLKDAALVEEFVRVAKADR